MASSLQNLRYYLVSLFFLFLAPHAYAEDVSLAGYASLDVRSFLEKPRYEGQHKGTEASAVLNPELFYKEQDYSMAFQPFYRRDSRDDARSHFDLRKAYIQYNNDSWGALVGINQVSWDVVSSHHLSNIINQVDFIEDIPSQDIRLGQPMVNDWGQLDYYVLPGFRQRTFPGISGHMRPIVPLIKKPKKPFCTSRLIITSLRIMRGSF